MFAAKQGRVLTAGCDLEKLKLCGSPTRVCMCVCVCSCSGMSQCPSSFPPPSYVYSVPSFLLLISHFLWCAGILEGKVVRRHTHIQRERRTSPIVIIGALAGGNIQFDKNQTCCLFLLSRSHPFMRTLVEGYWEACQPLTHPHTHACTFIWKLQFCAGDTRSEKLGSSCSQCAKWAGPAWRALHMLCGSI